MVDLIKPDTKKKIGTKTRTSASVGVGVRPADAGEALDAAAADADAAAAAAAASLESLALACCCSAFSGKDRLHDRDKYKQTRIIINENQGPREANRAAPNLARLRLRPRPRRTPTKATQAVRGTCSWFYISTDWCAKAHPTQGVVGVISTIACRRHITTSTSTSTSPSDIYI